MMTAALATLGYRVIGVDCDPDKIAALESGDYLVRNPGLDELLDLGRIMGRITVSEDILEAVQASEITLVTQDYGLDASGRQNPYPLMVMGRTLGTAIRHKAGRHTVLLNASADPELCPHVLVPAIAQGFGDGADQRIGVRDMPSQLRDHLGMRDFGQILSGFMPLAQMWDPETTSTGIGPSLMGLS